MGRPRLPEWNKLPATRRNDKWRLLSFARKKGTSHFISKVVPKAVEREGERLRAPKARDDVAQETPLAKFECCGIWLEFARARGAKGVYRSSVTKLEAKLTGDLSLGETTKGAFLDPAQALPLFLKLAYEGDFVPRTVTVPRLALFFDANEIYGRDKCQLISFSLPDARSPHQLGLQLPIARYLGKDDHITTFAVMTEFDLITALEVVLQTGWKGGPMELCISLDWQALRSFANVPPPTAQMCCVECWGVKDHFCFPKHVRQPLRDFLGYPSKLLPILRLIKRRENFSYEPVHANNHALANEIVHPLHIWCGKNLPGSYCIRLREIYACHFTRCPYYPPMTEACGKNDWSPANNLTKETIYNDKFWTEIQILLRQVVVRNGAEVIHDPFARYLTLMRKLMLQIIAWHPTEIERRDDMAREAHMLHHKIGLSKKGFGVVLHYFFEHFTESLKHEGRGPAYSIFQNRNAPKPAPKPAPEQPRPKLRPRPGRAGISACRAKRPKPEPKAAAVPPPPDPQPKAQACPFFTVAEGAAMHPKWPDSAEVKGVFGASLKGQAKQFVWFSGKIQGRLATAGQHGNRS